MERLGMWQEQARILIGRAERHETVADTAGPTIDKVIVDSIWLAEVLTALRALAESDDVPSTVTE